VEAVLGHVREEYSMPKMRTGSGCKLDSYDICR
jgi:hypothetical protein